MDSMPLDSVDASVFADRFTEGISVDPCRDPARFVFTSHHAGIPLQTLQDGDLALAEAGSDAEFLTVMCFVLVGGLEHFDYFSIYWE